MSNPMLALEGFCPNCEQALHGGICASCRHTVTVETIGDKTWVMESWPVVLPAEWSGDVVTWTGKAPQGPKP